MELTFALAIELIKSGFLPSRLVPSLKQMSTPALVRVQMAAAAHATVPPTASAAAAAAAITASHVRLFDIIPDADNVDLLIAILADSIC